MTGAGSASIAFAVEDSFQTLPGTPTWYQPGTDVEVGQANLQRALERARQPDDPRPKESREGNREGALSVTFTMTDTNFHKLVFPESTNTALASSSQLAPTATWYISSDTITSTEERFFDGAAVESIAWQYQQGNDVRIQLTIIYADEPNGTTPASITQPSAGDAVPFHGANLKLNATTVNKLQSFSVELSGMARFRRGQQQAPVDAVVGAYQPSLSMTAILEDNDHQQLAYGSTTATTPQDDMATQSGTAEFDNSSGKVADYTLTGLKPTSYDWSDVIGNTDTTDPTEFHCTNISVV